MKSIELALIVFDASTQARASIDEDVVTDYAEKMLNGVTFPPVDLFHDGNRYYMGDGFHRGLAAQRNGSVTIPATVHAGTREDALWFALGANRAHGHQMTVADKKHAVLLALKTWPERSQTQLAEQIGCTQGLISQVISANNLNATRPQRVTGKDGKSYPSARRTPERDGRIETIATMLKDGKSNTQIIEAIGADRNDLIAKVRRDLGLATVDKSRAAVAQRRKDIRDLAERGYTTRQIAASLGIDEGTISQIAKDEDIVIHADRAAGRTRRLDSDRIVERMVMDAENLTADVNLIDFSALDRSQIAGWLRSLQASRDQLGAFIRRLNKEQQNGQAA